MELIMPPQAEMQNKRSAIIDRKCLTSPFVIESTASDESREFKNGLTTEAPKKRGIKMIAVG